MSASGMPTEKATAAIAEEEVALAKKRKLLLTNIHMAGNMMLSLLTFNTRTVILAELTQGDPGRMSALLGLWETTIGAAEACMRTTPF